MTTQCPETETSPDVIQDKLSAELNGGLWEIYNGNLNSKLATMGPTGQPLCLCRGKFSPQLCDRKNLLPGLRLQG